jgi:PHP family Zn ribbon phosphoesterase
VADRVNELADSLKIPPPKYRPKYIHIIPLTEIITKVYGLSNTNSRKVQKIWQQLISKFDNEINVLINSKIEDIADVTDNGIADAIQCFRDNKIILHPGGGGKYGEIEIPIN